MSLVKQLYFPLRVISGALLIVWAAIHLYLSASLVKLLPIVGYFFIIDSILAIVGAIILFINLRILYLPLLVYNWINYLLVTESRVFPAPILGKPLPVINVYVIAVIIIDIILIALTTVTWIGSRR
ncbi:hypothetical protein [Acidianus brierleyi]|uniref:Uncharacterized protein n=1 Tax=Acidianus brierleyi TaxID=41673 RepID=A0A2U9IHW5_9CREN|nr:hypothetical protein [Acidianus brierleyi]AWR95591.1 hypothetical protein DFR85_14325 [Acidianus brierleyi]